MTLADLTAEMEDHKGHCAQGSECTAWQEYIECCCRAMDCLPWSDTYADAAVPTAFADHWLAVANGPDCP